MSCAALYRGRSLVITHLVVCNVVLITSIQPDQMPVLMAPPYLSWYVAAEAQLYQARVFWICFRTWLDTLAWTWEEKQSLVHTVAILDLISRMNTINQSIRGLRGENQTLKRLSLIGLRATFPSSPIASASSNSSACT